MLVLAGPGSGKTFVIIQRVLNLIHEKQVRPDNILVISFSKASTLELKQRFQKESEAKNQFKEDTTEEFKAKNQFKEDTTEESKAKNPFKTDITEQSNQKNNLINNVSDETKFDVNFSTFHACFFHILKETYHYTSKDIITEKQKRELLRTVLLNQLEQSQIKNLTEKIEDYLQKISYYKNKGTNALKEKETKEFQQIFHAYNQEMHVQRKLDFEDMGLMCLQLFQTRPEILEKWQEKFQYILIDEFQDINMVQFRIVQLLAKKYQNLFVVGDDDQAIYGFRGSNPQIMLDFEAYYPNAKKVLLETNYRCSEQIVKEALKVIEQNKVRFHKEIKAFGEKRNDIFKTKNDIGSVCITDNEEVIYQSFDNYQKEYTYIGEQIKNLTKKKNYQYSDFACIFRTNQDMAGLAEYFARNGIPFVMKESCNSIFQHFIALDILAYLHFFLEGRKRKDFIRIMNKPLRYLSRNAISAISDEVIRWNNLKQYYSFKPYMISYIEQLEQNEKWIQKLDLYGACFYIRKVIGYEQYLKEYVKEQNMNWEEAKEILDFVQESTRNMSSLEEWKEYIEQYEEALKNTGEEKEGVHMITMHGCKGLEYPIVFLPDCNEGKVPHKKAVTPEEVEEERRMFYVAMTRAKTHLEILYIEDKARKHLQPSRFLIKK